MIWTRLASNRRVGLASGITINSREIDMAKGEQRSNRETKKPKKEKIKVIAAAPSQKAGGWQPTVGSGKRNRVRRPYEADPIFRPAKRSGQG